MRAAIFGVLGLLAWFATQAVALGLSGGGHGWTGPFFFSMPLIILYPLTFILAFSSKARSPNVEVSLWAAAIVLNLLLLANIFSSEHDYFIRMWRFSDGSLFISIWLGLWAGWQVLFVAALLKRKVGNPRANNA